MDPMMVAAVQAAPVLLDRDATIAKVVALCEEAAAEGARLVAFPEAFVPGYPDWVWRTKPWDATSSALYARLLDQAVIVGSPATGLLAETARRFGIWLSVGASERDAAGATLYNALLHFAPDGTLAGRHRKLMPTGGERLVLGTGDGSTLDVIDTGSGRLGARPANRPGRHRLRHYSRSDMLRLIVDRAPKAAVTFTSRDDRGSAEPSAEPADVTAPAH